MSEARAQVLLRALAIAVQESRMVTDAGGSKTKNADRSLGS
ncbi:hypothetical protein [Rhodococcus erythropolis]|uniref:Uncharacterized protein n=1 Tax=Rhodococcus erythropolis TaxID=1833 RepID=A0AAX4A0E3_RHOER|nr:hypothetical protein [Rhodococcus erythropolis]WMN01893.1 hypothetical protein QIE55_31835 [Rhodococcus erythropolis]WMN03179.1 hypothetical protein QIE55_32780 [Rhodococcus erythropolis]